MQLRTLSVVLLALLLAAMAMVPMVSANPTAHDYDFNNLPDLMVGSTPSASGAASVQNTAGYSATSRTNYDASTAYNGLPSDALFMFIGHGLYSSGGDNGGGLMFYNGQKSYIYDIRPSSYPVGTVFVTDYSSTQLSNVRLVVLAGCYTGDTSSTRGNLVSKLYNKGAKNVIGWTGNQNMAKLQSWSSNFWTRTNNGESFYTAAQNAVSDSYWIWPSGYNGIDNFAFWGGNGFLIPAGYGS